jgi:TRAP-type mannitol/chloroaromatic compound transport system permease small subunit
MAATIGNVLNWLAAGVLFPLLLLPLAALAAGRKKGVSIWLALLVVTYGAASGFAYLAVDLNPPKLSGGLIVTLLGGVGIIGALLSQASAATLSERLAAPIEEVVKRVGRLSLYLILAMALAQFAIVILRYVFGLNFIAMQESITYLHGGVFLLAGGYALITDDHVRVDIFYREAPPRKKAWVDLFGAYLLLFPFCLVALWAAGPYVANSWAVREGSMEQSGIRGVYLLKSLIPIYLTLLALAGFVTATKAVQTLKTRGV